jgi:hypothetical protein
MDTPSHFCSMCLDMLKRLSESSQETPAVWLKAASQQFEAFREAAQQGCFICSTLWNLSEEHRVAWSSSPQVPWMPIQYRAESEFSGSMIRLSILYHDPVRDVTTDIRFRMINTNCTHSISRSGRDYGKLTFLRQRIQSPFLIQERPAKHVLV